MGVLEECGGTAYLADVAACVGTSVNAAHHARLVKGKATRRETIRLASQLANDGFESPEDIIKIIETATG